MVERLLRIKQVMELYGLSEHQARIAMMRAGRINIGASDEFPRWACTASKLDAYFNGQAETAITGLDSSGKLLRR